MNAAERGRLGGKRSGEARRAKAALWQAKALVLGRKACAIDPSMSNAGIARFIVAHWRDPAYAEECALAIARVIVGQLEGHA